jgi:hypothetical protein
MPSMVQYLPGSLPPERIVVLVARQRKPGEAVVGRVEDPTVRVYCAPKVHL